MTNQRLPRLVPMSHCWELLERGGHDVPKDKINTCRVCDAHVCDDHGSTHEARHIVDIEDDTKGTGY